MDIEFHYYMTYLIAARAGFNPDEASILAHSAQGVDDNHILLEIDKGKPGHYLNAISQTMNILNAHDDVFIYPIFHFIPGEPNAPTAARFDGKTDGWTTTPNSQLAIDMLESALDSNDLYRIGVSAHGYADTWAHQNFIGRRHSFNVMPVSGSNSLIQQIEDALFPVGHGAAEHQPDVPSLIWTDGRLVNENQMVINRDRFLDAARHLFMHFAEFRGRIPAERLQSEADALCADLAADIGTPSKDDPTADAQALKDARIDRYNKRSLTPAYGATELGIYNPNDWFQGALIESFQDVDNQWGGKWNTIREKCLEVADKVLGESGSIIEDIVRNDDRIQCNWRNPIGYQVTDWYQFQQAVKSHLQECEEILQKKDLPGVSKWHSQTEMAGS